MKNKHSSEKYLVVGLGQTGLSCVRFLRANDCPVVVADTRQHPPALTDCQTQYPDVPVHLGPFSQEFFLQADVIVVSPGVSWQAPEILAAADNGARIIGDVELFAQTAKAPIIAITGSNGKSTLTTLVGKMIEDAGLKAIVCGNIGLPVLDVLSRPVPDYYVVELSSFQLATTHSLKAKVAVVLNISPDHLDRHESFEEYLAAKQTAYHQCEVGIVNADEPVIWADLSFNHQPIQFTLSVPKKDVWGIKDQALCYGDEQLIAIADLSLKERHNCQNFLAALAIGSAIDLSLASMLETLKTFTGLPHRCQLVSQKNDIYWINDSKATNEGAAVAAIESIAQDITGRLILIAGGDSKGVELEGLREAVKKKVSHVITLGRDGDKIATLLRGCADITSVTNMQEAVAAASTIAQRGDTVLLSPACASLDQYANYMARGDDFVQAVEAL